jgi:RimJ/RimL family protein N-acetyltransferase
MITGSKIVLLPYESSDYAKIVEWHKDPLFDDVMSDELRDKGETDIISFYQQFFPPNGRIFVGGIKKGSGYQRIGIVGLTNIDWKNRKAEIYGGIGPKDLRAQGYGIDAIETVVDWARKQLGLHRIYAIVKAHNEPAIRSLVEAGFRREGDMKDAHFQDGNFINKVMLASVPERYTLGHKRRQ